MDCKGAVLLTIKERIAVSRLIQMIDSNSKYAKEIGLSYKLEMTKNEKSFNKHDLKLQED